jgi:hypothetical protein
LATIYNEQSTFGWRRYDHWATAAEKARLLAFLIWQTCDPDPVQQLEQDGLLLCLSLQFKVLT